MYIHGKPLSYRQRLAARLWIEGGRKSKANALRNAGYSEAVCRQPHKFFNSPMVRAELDILGYGEDGMGERQPPKVVEVQHEPKPQEQAFDVNSLSEEAIMALKEALNYDNIRQPEPEEGTSYTSPKPNSDVFGESAQPISYSTSKPIGHLSSM